MAAESGSELTSYSSFMRKMLLTLLWPRPYKEPRFLAVGLYTPTVLVVGCGNTGSSSAKRAPTDNAAPFRADIAAYNAGYAKSMLRLVTFSGQIDCAVGSLKEFPGSTLVTAINSSGRWAQVTMHNGKFEQTSFRSGSDYTTDLPDGDWATFKATSGVGCSMDSSGTITIN